MIPIWIWVAAFGALGVLSRFALTKLSMATLIANLVGSFAIGLIYVWATERLQISETLRIAIMVGFLGGFTTMSSYSLETLRFIENKQFPQAILYGIGTPLACIALTYLGALLARQLIPH